MAFASSMLRTIKNVAKHAHAPSSILLRFSQKSIPERAIFQTFWKDDFCTKSLFFELETSNFGYILAYFLILFDYAKFRKDWTTFILDILQGSPFEFLVNYKNKKHQRGDPCKMSNINVVQSF